MFWPVVICRRSLRRFLIVGVFIVNWIWWNSSTIYWMSTSLTKSSWLKWNYKPVTFKMCKKFHLLNMQSCYGLERKAPVSKTYWITPRLSTSYLNVRLALVSFCSTREAKYSLVDVYPSAKGQIGLKIDDLLKRLCTLSSYYNLKVQ